jgi:hypothetical protein
MTTELQLPPSVESGEKMEKLSSKYVFIDTKKVIAVLEDYDYFVTTSNHLKPRRRDPKVVRHFVRMRHRSAVEQVNGAIPEIVIVNSHDGTSSLRFMAGLFRMVCENGLIVQDTETAFEKITHTRNAEEEALKAAARVLLNAQENARRIEVFRRQILSPIEVMEFATLASRNVWSGRVEPAALLEARRDEDRDSSLWSVFNRVQENLIKGGIPGVSPNGRRTRTHGIRAMDNSMRVNLKLWQLAEEFLP